MLKMIRFGEIIVKNDTFNLGLSRSLNYFLIFHLKMKNAQNDEILRENCKFNLGLT